MDSLITAAARALAAGDPLGALNRVALRDDAPALALRGIAMAQLGDFMRAKALVRRAARAFGPRESVASARCVVAGLHRIYGDMPGIENVPVSGTADDVARGVREVIDAGAEMVLLNPVGTGVTEDREQMERLAAEVIPQLQ